jgi:uncharacterized protein
LTDAHTISLTAPLGNAAGSDFACRRWLTSTFGHLWTVFPAVWHEFADFAPRFGRPFSTVLHDSTMGAVRLSGLLDEPADTDSLVLIVHGYGSHALSPQCAAMARAARAAGIASLRLSLRGADLSGDDIYHGGLTEDLRAALASPEVRRYRKIFLAGYSVGGQIALRASLDKIDSRIRATAAICAPLDLAAGADEFDRPSRGIYRSYIFSRLNRVYAATAARRPLPTSVEIVRRARFTRERDELTVVPRFGYRSADDYYDRTQVAHELHRLDVPSLLVVSENDPMVPLYTLRKATNSASRALKVVHVHGGGHLQFPRDLDLGQPGPMGLEPQVTQWLIGNQ